MKINLFGVIEAEGEPEALSVYTSLFFSGMKQVVQIQQEQEENSKIAELFRSIDDSLKKGGDKKS